VLKVISHTTNPSFYEGAKLLSFNGFNVESRQEVDPFYRSSTERTPGRGGAGATRSPELGPSKTDSAAAPPDTKTPPRGPASVRTERTPGTSDRGKGETLPSVVNSRFCFDKANPAGFRFDAKWQCGTTEWYYNRRAAMTLPNDPNRQSTFNDDIVIYCNTATQTASAVRNVKLQVRSIYAIFRFLGDILRSKDPPRILRTSTSPVGVPLLDIQKDRRHGCFAASDFDGELYCVSQDASPATNVVFSVLAQLIALKTQPGDLPFTPSVRIVP
jgi:hypothetical protein